MAQFQYKKNCTKGSVVTLYHKTNQNPWSSQTILNHIGWFFFFFNNKYLKVQYIGELLLNCKVTTMGKCVISLVYLNIRCLLYLIFASVVKGNLLTGASCPAQVYARELWLMEN